MWSLLCLLRATQGWAQLERSNHSKKELPAFFLTCIVAFLSLGAQVQSDTKTISTCVLLLRSFNH